ncbi:MAG: hypothetical protein HY769_00070 [Candidatus Stahlbacteria bacterium]|nr:hypothetical protein [Candidatus Stahlbacteria bacterium]
MNGAIRKIVAKRTSLRSAFQTFPWQRQRWVWAYWYLAPPYRWYDWIRIPWHYDGGYGNGNIQVGFAEGEPAHLQQIYNLVDNVHQIQELRAQGGTPIGGALYLARQELTAEIQRDLNGQMTCRRYFCIILGDGEETGYPNNNPNSPYIEATRLRDVVVSGKHFDIQTYVVGIAVTGGTGAQCLDSIAKLGGTYHYYPATSPAALDSILDMLTSDIEHKSFSFAAPEVPAVRTKYYNSIYLASFMPSSYPFWNGYLKAYRLNPDGTFPQDSLGQPLYPALWEAGERLKLMSISSRQIYSEKVGALVPFTPFYITSTDLQVPADSVEPLINLVRGSNGYDWKLGDVFHSWPICVGAPSPYYFDDGYNQFKYDKAHRGRVLIVGTNDGMLHCFDAGTYVATGDSFTAGTGDEKWAFIPNNLLPKLQQLRTIHQYYVDGNPVVFDAWFPSGPTDSTKEVDEWKTVLICGERQGGNRYFALNITDTYNPVFLWNFSDTSLSQTWSNPAIGKVKIGGKEKWIAVVGGGFNKSAGAGRAVYVLNVMDGSIIWKFTDANLTYSLPSDPSVIDMPSAINGPPDGFIDYVYIGDIGGQMWKLDIKGNSVAQWQGYRVFKSQQDQPFYYPPACAFDKQWNFWLFFGGGDRDSVRKTNTFNRFYGMRDNGQTAYYTDADLKDVTGGGTANDNGWYIKLNKDEKSLAKSLVFGEVSYFTTYEPTTDDPCLALGIARLYRVGFTTGKALEGEPISEEIGYGLPTSPQVSVTPGGDFVVTVGASRGEIISEQIEGSGAFKKIIYWKEEKY